MENKYNPGMIHLDAATYISPLVFKDDSTYKMDNKYFKEVDVYIEWKENKRKCYRIRLNEEGKVMLLEGKSSTSTQWRKRKNEVLYENRNKLEKVDIAYKNRSMITFSNYDEFWKKIKRE